jgi:hypothetical protein
LRKKNRPPYRQPAVGPETIRKKSLGEKEAVWRCYTDLHRDGFLPGVKLLRKMYAGKSPVDD